MATISIVANSISADEGSSAGFTIAASNYNRGNYYEFVSYIISGVSTQDLLINTLYDGVILSASSPSRYLSIPIYNDRKTEGIEILTVTIGNESASILINDTSKNSPTYSLVAKSSSVNEGTTATFTLTTTDVTSGSSVPYTLSGISAADVLGGSLSGNAVVNSSGVATISVALLNDLLTEGAETLQVTAGGASASTVVNDTSITLVGTVIGPNTGGSGFGVGSGVGGGG